MYLISAPRVGVKDISLHNHEEKPYKGRHRDPQNKRRKRRDKADAQIYDHGLKEVTEAIEAERRENGK